jgi:hypothetical protein
MPYNPNDPASDQHNPENEAPLVPTTTPENALTVEDKVRTCYVHATVRSQPKEAEWTVSKLDQILTSKRNKTVTAEQANTMLDELVATDIATWVLDPVTKQYIDVAVEAVRNAYQD